MEAGIAHGSTLATAHSIVPGLVHYRRCRERERERLELLAGTLYGFSSRVSLTSPAADDHPPGGIMLEIGGSLKLFGDGAELARRVEDVCRGMGHEVRVRPATTALAALVLARADAASLCEVPLVHAAVEPEPSDGGRHRAVRQHGHSHPESAPGPAEAAASPGGSAKIWWTTSTVSPAASRTRARRSGRRNTSASNLHLLEPLNGKEALIFPMQRLLGDLQHWLVARQLGAEALGWSFTGSGGARIRMRVRFTRARQRREDFLDITRLKLTETTLPEDVISLTLEARRLMPWAAVSRPAGLFDQRPGPAAEVMEEPGALVDQLRARLGRDACHGLVTADHHTPELAWQQTAPLPRSRELPGRSRARRRPLWLFDPPRPVDRRQLELLEGPERIHTGWWLTTDHHAPPGQARDYYMARHHSGARCWVFTDSWDRWYLHGYFA